MSIPAKKIVIIAGPNGVGKTTFAQEFLPNEAGCPVFVNADLIAAGLSPFEPQAVALRAGRLMLREIAHHAAAARSFAFETTLSGKTYAPWLRSLRALTCASEALAGLLRSDGESLKAQLSGR